MRRKTLLFLAIALAAGYPLFAQDFQNEIPQVKPLPPDAAGLFKTLERPIGSFTGTVPVSFPLCTLNSGPLSAALSFSYTGGGGLKVEEIAGSVGLGFSLEDGGGRITQVVHGLADDQTSGMLTNSTRPSNFNCGDMTQVGQCYYQPYGIDLEPDLFMYSFHGQSGKFFLKEDGTVVMLQNTTLKVEYTNAGANYGGIASWTITDEKGSKYYFDSKLENSYTYQSLTNPTVTSSGPSTYSWYLSEVDDMNGENKLTYSYQSAGAAFVTYSGGFTTIPQSPYFCPGFNLTSDQAQVTTEAGEELVARIDGSSGYVLISASNTRADGYYTQVDSIRLFDSTGVLKKKYHFNYGCFNAGGDIAARRLKLASFSEFGSSGTDSSTWSFTYNETQNLPSRYSTSVDYWGFYNNAVNNNGLCPNIVFNNEGGYVMRSSNLADRNAVAGYGMADILTKITWPTGGYRQFTYEGNTALLSWNKDMYMPDPAYSTSRSFSSSSFNTNVAPSPCSQQYFTVSSTDGGTLFTYTVSGSCSGYTVNVYKLDSATQSTGGVQQVDMPALTSYNLANGYYRLEIYQPSSYCGLSSITGNWGECTLTDSTIALYYYLSPNRNNRSVGGVRVKEIDDYDPVTGKTNSTQYLYKLYGQDSTLTSGLLISPLNLVTQVSPVGCGNWKLLSSSNYPLTQEGGSYVVYPQVRTIESGNGWTDRTYSYLPDEPSYSYPDAPPADYSAYRGELLSEQVYNNSSTLLHKKTYDYALLAGPSQGGIKVKAIWYYFVSPYWAEYPIPVNNAPPTNSYCNDYGYSSTPRALDKTIDSTFMAGGKQGVETDYVYDTTNNRLVLSQTKTTINNGQTKVTRYKYPFTANTQFTFGLTVGEQTLKSTLQSNNYLQPLETVDSLLPVSGTGSLLGGNKLIFGTFNGSTIHLSKARSYTTLSDSTELNFTQYDYKGNLQEQYRTSDIKAVYLWGYKGNYPVAKVTGSSYSTVAGFVSQGVLSNPSSDIALRAELNKIRTGLAGTTAQVTTYTYNPQVGMTSMTDPSGKIVYYLYDGFGRLQVIRDQAGNVVKKYCYNYQGQSGACSLYGNVMKTGAYTRNNCGGDSTGGTVHDTVVANTWFATTQVQADSMAQADVTTNGQSYANSHGSCTYTLYYSHDEGATRQKNNCGGDSVGSVELYDVPAGTYTSTISQAYADSLASHDVIVNAQTYANSHGTCTDPGMTLDYWEYGYVNFPFYFTFTNTSTSQQYHFQTDPSYYNEVIGNLPPGTYNVTIYNQYNSGYHTFQIGCYNYTSGTLNFSPIYMYLYDVYMDGSCTDIFIDY